MQRSTFAPFPRCNFQSLGTHAGTLSTRPWPPTRAKSLLPAVIKTQTRRKKKLLGSSAQAEHLPLKTCYFMKSGGRQSGRGKKRLLEAIEWHLFSD